MPLQQTAFWKHGDKEEIALYKQFLLLSPCYQFYLIIELKFKGCFQSHLRQIYFMWERVKAGKIVILQNDPILKFSRNVQEKCPRPEGLFTRKGLDPVAQTVAMQAVNQGVLSSNPGSANFLSDVWQMSMRHASFVFHVYQGKAASCLGKLLCVVLVWENQETHE